MITRKGNVSILLLSILVLIALGFFVWQVSQKPNFNSEINNPFDQPSGETEKITTNQSAATTENETENVTPQSEKILLTPDIYQQYNLPNFPDSCGNEPRFNYDPPTTFATYSKNGITIQIPYNPHWGSDKFRVNPYDEDKNRISFGTIGRGEGCGLERSGHIYLLPPLSIDQTNDRIKRETNDDLLWSKPTQEQINGLTVVKYGGDGMCSTAIYEIVGKQFNYRIFYFCIDRFEPLTELLKTASVY